jgi:hypothetical integral membrane protein (TIGR02206 family)
MIQFFTLEFDGGPFKLFATSHLVALGIFAVLIFFMIINRRNFSDRAKQNIRYSMAAVLVINEILWHIWNLSTGQWTVQTMLPLHLCSVLVWLNAYMLVKKNYAIYEFAYLLGIAGALQALLTPDLGIYDFPHFRYYQVFVSHGLIITSAIYMTVVEGFRPYPRSVLRVLVISNIYLVAVTAINLTIKSNYLFTAHKPVTASLLDVLPPWPWYILIIELLGMVFVALFYLPFLIKDSRKKTVITPLSDPDLS